jgi:hypothetical protein
LSFSDVLLLRRSCTAWESRVAGVSRRSEPPDVAQQLVLGEDPGRLGGQRGEQPELGGRERDKLAADADLPRRAPRAALSTR